MSMRFKRSLGLFTAAALIAGPICTTSAAAQRVEVGNAAAVVGKVTVQVDGDGKKEDVERKDRFAWGDLIATAKKSQLQILLLDRSTFGMGERSQVTIDRYVYNPDEGRSAFATLIKGALRFFSGRQEGENSAEVKTPAGRIGVRGTAVDMLVGENAEKIAEDEESIGKVQSNKDEATLVVLRGPGTATEGGLVPGLVEVEGAGVTVTLDRPGLAAYIPRAGAAPIGPFSISNKGLAQVQDQLAPEVARAAKGGGLLETLVPIAVGAIAIGAILDGGGDGGGATTPPRTNRTDDNTATGQISRPQSQTGSSQTSGSTAPDPKRPN